jgi:AcrR family transcriptional regulator
MELLPSFTYRFSNKRVSILRNPKDGIFQVLIEQYLEPEVIKRLVEEGHEDKPYDHLVRNRIRVRRYFFHPDTMHAMSQGFEQHVLHAQENQVLKQRRENAKAARTTERLLLSQAVDQPELKASPVIQRKPRKPK